MHWQIFPSFLLITLLSLAAVSWYGSTAYRQNYFESIGGDLEARGHLVLPQIRPLLEFGGGRGEIDALCKRLGRSSSTRITVVLPSGKVLGDSKEEPSKMENHGARPEIRRAFEGSVGSSIRHSTTVNQKMMYVALPMQRGRAIIGVVRTSIPVTSIEDTMAQIYRRIALGGVVIALLAAVLSLWLSRRISRPLEELKKGAQRFAAGELDLKLPVDGSSEELGSLAETLNRMAEELDDRISAVLRQKNEQTAVLASMVEGVVAVDSEQRLLNINQAAANMFGVDPARAGNKPISTVIDNRMLHDFILRILGGRQAIDGEIVLDEGEMILQCQGTPLLDAQGNFIGALAVFHDQTRLRKLEDLRREFVSNVSHELKTPITTIKGFVETLLDGNLDEPEDTRKFLGIIYKHSDRLNAIIDDLLSLSRIEREEELAGIELEPGSVGDVLLAAVQACELKARDKNISLELTCGSALRARINPPLLEQAVVNLIDNAIKYSDPGGAVGIDSASAGQEVRIRVIDRGCGIPAGHHERIFERFYRVDKARSRNLGGTGLGLAIVKHIAVTHSGSVSVQSAPGQGSTFTLHLPIS